MAKSYIYVDAFAHNTPSSTIVWCVSCAKDKSDNPHEEYMTIMYDEAEDWNYLVCDSCGDVIRDWE